MNQATEAIKQTEETTDVVNEALERIRNPFLAGFIISWCIINYQFWLIIFSEASINWKIGTIAELHPMYSWEWIINYFILPISASVFLRLISHLYPIIDSCVKAFASTATLFLDGAGFKNHAIIRIEKLGLERVINELENKTYQLEEGISDKSKHIINQDLKITQLRIAESAHYDKLTTSNIDAEILNSIIIRILETPINTETKNIFSNLSRIESARLSHKKTKHYQFNENGWHIVNNHEEKYLNQHKAIIDKIIDHLEKQKTS